MLQSISVPAWALIFGSIAIGLIGGIFQNIIANIATPHVSAGFRAMSGGFRAYRAYLIASEIHVAEMGAVHPLFIWINSMPRLINFIAIGGLFLGFSLLLATKGGSGSITPEKKNIILLILAGSAFVPAISFSLASAECWRAMDIMSNPGAYAVKRWAHARKKGLPIDEPLMKLRSLRDAQYPILTPPRAAH